MDYEQKYNKALEVAKNWLENGETMDTTKKCLECIFPELAESEDERIRKGLMQLVKARANCNDVERMLAYLEKQKDPVVNGRGLYYYDGEKFTYCGYPATKDNPYDFAMSQQEKQKEQKPAEKPDLVVQLKEHLANTPKEQLEKEWKELEPWGIGPTVHEFLYGKPAEWSEDDEKMLRTIISDGVRGVGLDNSQVDWLKSLRPQPHKWYIKKGHWYMCIVDKPEYGWRKGKVYQSPEDNRIETDHKGDLTNWPDSEPWFRPATRDEIPERRPHWKPSKEQMRCLEFAIKQLERNYLIGPGRAEDKGLYQLVNDLRTL